MAMVINEQHYPQRHEIQIKPGERLSICRCWRSQKFPLCDGAHKAYCAGSKDMVGPAVITVAEETTSEKPA